MGQTTRAPISLKVVLQKWLKLAVNAVALRPSQTELALVGEIGRRSAYPRFAQALLKSLVKLSEACLIAANRSAGPFTPTVENCANSNVFKAN